ncbi:hypothetical protein D3C73_1431360 [compost metagenome]
MTGKVTAEVSDTALGTMGEGQRFLKSQSCKHSAQRLAGFSRVDNCFLTGKVLFFIFFGLQIFFCFRNKVVGTGAFKDSFSFNKIQVRLSFKQSIMILYFRCFSH